MPGPSSSVVFVSVDSSGKPAGTDRAKIRSACMRGRNKQSGSRRSLREAKRASKTASAAAAATTHHDTAAAARKKAQEDDHNGMAAAASALRSHYLPGTLSGDELRDYEEVMRSPLSDEEGVLAEDEVLRWKQQRAWMVQRLKGFSSVASCPVDTAFMRWAGDSNSSSQHLLSQLILYRNLRYISFPIEASLSFPNHSDLLIPWLIHDEAFYYSALFSASAMQDLMLDPPRSPYRSGATLGYLGRTLEALARKLSRRGGGEGVEAWRSNATAYTVMSLAVVANMAGEREVAGQHVRGLYRMLNLRGGREHLRREPKFHFKVDRLDLGLALSSGRSRKYLTGTRMPMHAALPPARHRSDDLISLTTVQQNDGQPGRFNVDSRIATAFKDMQHLAVLINEHYDREERLGGDIFQEVVGSTQLLLLNVGPFKKQDGLSEGIRLGMLAFLSTLVSIPGRRVPYPYLERLFRGELEKYNDRQELDHEEGHVTLLWLLMMGAMSVLSPEEEPWLRERWHRTSRNEQSWDVVRAQLRRMIWIDNIHDEAGKEAFEKLKLP